MASTPRFSPGLSQEELVAGYRKVGSRAPFTKKDVQKAYQPYGLKLDPKNRRKATDATLQKTAAQAVVKWHKKQKAQTAAKKSSPSKAPASTSKTQAMARTASPAARSVARSVAPVSIAPKAPKPVAIDDRFITSVMKRIGLTGVNAASIPAKHRTSPKALEDYLNQLKAQRALAPRSTGGGRTLIR